MKPCYTLTDIVTNEEVPRTPVTDALVEQVLYAWSLRLDGGVVTPCEVYLPENKGSMDAQLLLVLTEPWDGSQA